MGRPAKPQPVPDVWSDSVGQIPHKVVVREEPTRAWRVYLWWRREGADGSKNWGKESLRMTLRDAAQYFLPDVESRKAKATLAASKKYAQLYGGEPVTPATPIAKTPVLTIGATKALITDPKRGKYRHPSKYRDEVTRALDFAATVWGSETTWESLQRSSWVELMTARLTQLVREEHSGFGATEHTIRRLVTVLAWLKEEDKVPDTVPPPKKDWKEQLAKEWRSVSGSHKPYEVARPRYKLDELLKILKAAWDVDPRFGLLVNVGVGLRLGQVRKCMRSDLAVEAIEGGDVLVLTVHGDGKKKGAVIELTPGQRAVMESTLTGLYATLEAKWLAERVDYPLFPGGRMQGLESRRRKEELSPFTKRKPVALTDKMHLDAPVSDNWWLKRWKEAQTLAKVADVKGRKSYGGKRIVVDEAIDRELGDRGLKALGGWSSVNVPKGIYADQDSRKGRREAREAKESILGEAGVPGVHSGKPRTTDVPESNRPASESGTPGNEEISREANV